MRPTVSSPGPAEVGGLVLAGGSAVRLQGADKASIEVAGVTLLEHVLGALAGVPEVVVVGDEVPTSRPVTFLREDPPGGGPAAGLLAGLAGFARAPRLTVVLAVDLPLVTTATVQRLRDRLAGSDGSLDGALLVDGDGRRQYLCAVYRTRSLLAAAPAPEDQHGLAVRRLVGDLRLAEVPAEGGEADDVDSWDDLLAIRNRLGG
jgi:molybdopterin-guanine dinucleotide biosynthesis protein A